MSTLEEITAKFLEDEECRIIVRKAGKFRFLQDYRFLEHKHREYEINFISYGRCTMVIEDKTVDLRQGQCIVIPPRRRHSFRVNATGGSRLTQLEMAEIAGPHDDGFLSKEYQSVAADFESSYSPEPWDYHVLGDCEDILPIIDRIARVFRQEQNEYTAFFLKLSAVELMMLLNYHINVLTGHFSSRARGNMNDVITYLQEHYTEHIDLEDVAQKAGVSSRYLRKYFAEVMGCSCVRYITSLRMEKAKHLLWETDQSILSVALESGYDNVQYFNRLFKKTEGVTPTEYRSRWREIPLEENQNAVPVLGEIYDVDQRDEVS